MSTISKLSLSGAIEQKGKIKGIVSADHLLKGTISEKSSLMGRVAIGDALPDDTQTFILVDSKGNEIPAVLVDEEVEINATSNDIREGITAVTSEGVTLGTKFIPPYYTSVGERLVRTGREIDIYLPVRDAFDYTALQCIICPLNTSIDQSVAAEKVVIGNGVYEVKSTELLSNVTKNHDTKTVKLGITNNSGLSCIIRYFTYKEEN